MDVRRVGVADWEVVREVRLRALADAPEAFGSSYEREAAFAERDWIDRVGADNNATLVCESDEHRCAIVTLVGDVSDRRAASLVGMWVAPLFRGTGVADLLVESVLRWADDQGIVTVRLHVAEGNARAERLYRRHGFSRTGQTFAGARPGLIEIEMARTMSSSQR